MEEKTKKEIIIAEKLTTGISYRQLAAKHNLCYQTIHQWVQEYHGKVRNRRGEKKAKTKLFAPGNQLPTEVKQLQEDLRKALLLNEILTEVINVAEEELKIPIRKKFGTK